MFDAWGLAGDSQDGFGPASLVCRIADPGRGWRRRCGEVHVIVVQTEDGAFTQVCRRPERGRDIFVELILPGHAVEAARDYALRRFASASGLTGDRVEPGEGLGGQFELGCGQVLGQMGGR